jgi:hypothetical protein
MTKQLISNLLSTVLNKGLQFLKTIYTMVLFGIGLLQVDVGWKSSILCSEKSGNFLQFGHFQPMNHILSWLHL